MKDRQIKIIELFKVPIYEVKLDLDTKNFIHYFDTYKKLNKSRLRSNLGGYQSPDLDVNSPPVNELKERIESHATIFAKVLLNDHPQFVDNMWLNVNKCKASNLTHCHPGSDLSGVYYLKTPKNCGGIVFDHPAKHALSYSNFHGKTENFNVYNSLEWVFKPEPDTLLLFPAWLNHYVQPNQNKTKERMSISFNTHER